jgi:hypothetical protein
MPMKKVILLTLSLVTATMFVACRKDTKQTTAQATKEKQVSPYAEPNIIDETQDFVEACHSGDVDKVIDTYFKLQSTGGMIGDEVEAAFDIFLENASPEDLDKLSYAFSK